MSVAAGLTVCKQVRRTGTDASSAAVRRQMGQNNKGTVKYAKLQLIFLQIAKEGGVKMLVYI